MRSLDIVVHSNNTVLKKITLIAFALICGVIAYSDLQAHRYGRGGWGYGGGYIPPMPAGDAGWLVFQPIFGPFGVLDMGRLDGYT